MVAVAIGIMALGILGILIFNALWFRIGLGATIAIIVGILLYLGWREDQKTAARREGLET